MRRVVISNPEKAKAAIKDEIHRTNETRLQHRLHCILLICDGRTCAGIVALFGDSLRAVQYWVKRYNEAGIDGLRDPTRVGRNPRLLPGDKDVLAQDLRRSPREFGYTQNLWDGKLLSHHLKERFNVELKVRQCQNLFHQLGFRRRKPRPVIAKADMEAQEAYKKLEGLAGDKQVDMWFMDECHFQQHGSRLATWFPPEEKDPVIKHAPVRNKVGIIGAVRANDGILVTCEHDKFNAQTIEAFLTELVKYRDEHKAMIVILDNARFHHAKALSGWLERHSQYLHLDFLPPCSPELNPIERVWKLTRRLCTHNQYFERLDDLRRSVFTKFREWFCPNQALVQLCAIN